MNAPAVHCSRPLAMASGPSSCTRSAKPVQDGEMADLKRMINSLSSKVDSKLDRISNQIQTVKEDLLQQLDKKIKDTREELHAEIERLTERLDRLETTRAQNHGDVQDLRAPMEFG